VSYFSLALHGLVLVLVLVLGLGLGLEVQRVRGLDLRLSLLS
jgi:hypothetical protein